MNCLQLSKSDNVAVVVCPNGIEANDSVHVEPDASELKALERITRGHKLAIRRIKQGEPIIKLGCTIGLAKRDIEPGDHVHIHNIETLPTDAATDVIRGVAPRLAASPATPLRNTFRGFPRAGGSAGIRNYIVVVASVNCSATVVKAVCRHFWGKHYSEKGIDGVVPVSDPAGCTQVPGGEYHALLNQTLAGWIDHPNVVGALIIGLGCEGTTFKSILSARARHVSSALVEHFNIQEFGGTASAIREGIRRVECLLNRLPNFTRSEVPVSHLKLALNCGGSDAFSALTANPALGYASDLLVSQRGTVVLAEIPECHGAEELIYQRLKSEDLGPKLSRIFDWWQQYSVRHRVSFNHNLAVGNMEGGISTIIEKSIGALAKAGSGTFNQVLNYAERITEKGLVLMNTPGYDPVSVTGLVAGGCNIVAFTTGRGSVYGCSIAPTIKIATTSQLFERMSGDMDIDAGVALQGTSLPELGHRIYDFLLDVAEGKPTCSESLGLGWEEFIPWATGEVL